MSPLTFNGLRIVGFLAFAALGFLQNGSATPSFVQSEDDAVAPRSGVLNPHGGTLDGTSFRKNLQQISDLMSPTLAADGDVDETILRDRDTLAHASLEPYAHLSRNWLLLIGIDRYSHLSPLKNSVGDLNRVRDILLERYQFDAEHLIELYDLEATRENIILELERLAREAGPADNVLIYYEGHGSYSRAFRRGYWLPVDANTQTTAQYLPGVELQSYLSAIHCRSILVISDACFSGAFFPSEEKPVPFKPTVDQIQRAALHNARQVLTSGGKETVAGNWLFLDHHSLFAHYLIDRLQKNTDKYLAASSLFLQVKIPVSNKGFQTPEYKTIRDTGDEGGEFVFVRK